jgi:transposase
MIGEIVTTVNVVVMDNLKVVRRLIRSVGDQALFLPKDSPDLNPIEQVFAKPKHLLRKGCRADRRDGLRRHR